MAWSRLSTSDQLLIGGWIIGCMVFVVVWFRAIRSGDASAIRGRFDRTGFPKFGPRSVTAIVPTVFVGNLAFFVPDPWSVFCAAGFLVGGVLFFVVGLTGHPRSLIPTVFRDQAG
jgi:hypothetical protein